MTPNRKPAAQKCDAQFNASEVNEMSDPVGVRIKLIDYLSPETEIQRSKFALVFGSRHAQADLSRAAFDLFHSGYYETLIIAGGRTRGGPRSEAREIADGLVSQGFSPARLVLEETSTNTAENVIHTRDLMATADVRDLLLIGKIYAKRRYVMTIKKNWPEIARISCMAVNYFGVTRDQWWKSLCLRRRILSEARKTKEYLQKGYLSEIEVVDGGFVL